MALTDELDAMRVLLSCIQADGCHVSHVNIEEKDELAKLKRLCLSELKPQMLVLAIDEARKVKNDKNQTLRVCMSPLFSEQDYGHNKACDAVLLRKTEAGIEIYYIDLKSDNPSGFERQFKSSQCFMRYLFDLAKSLCNIEIQIIKERFIIFHTDSKDASRFGLKPKTRFSPKSANKPDSPEMFCVRNGETVRCTEIF